VLGGKFAFRYNSFLEIKIVHCVIARSPGSLIADRGCHARKLYHLGVRHDVEHDTAPFAVEGSKHGIHGIGAGATDLHGQAAERAMRMRRVGIHASIHRLVWLSKGKRPLHAKAGPNPDAGAGCDAIPRAGCGGAP